MYALIFGLLLVLLLALASVFYKNTPLEFSPARGRYAGILIYMQLFFLTGLGVVLINVFGPNRFHDFDNTTDESVPGISAIIFWSIFIFIVVSGLFLKKISRWISQEQESTQDREDQSQRRIYILAVAVALLGIVTCIGTIIIFDAKHVMLQSLFGGERLVTLRLANIYKTGMPTVFNSLIRFSYTLLATLLGTNTVFRKRTAFVLLVGVCLYLATFQGNKSPIVSCFIIYFVVRLISSGRTVGIGLVLRGVFAGLVVFGIVYAVIILQFKGADSFELQNYVLDRLGVGQVAGVYETLNLKMHNIVYLWHSVPFANWFMHTPVFAKDLMVASGNVSDPTTTGVKNGLFVSEAFGIGGWPLVFLSPFIVGMNYALSYFILLKVWRKLFSINAKSLSIILAILFTGMADMTGDIATFLFFKGLLMLLVFSLLLWLSWFVVNIFRMVALDLCRVRADSKGVRA